MAKNYDFFIQSPKWQRNFFIGALILGVAGPIILTILWLALSFDWGILVGGLLVFIIPLILGPLGLYVWHKETFSFQNGTFTYTKPFKKSQSATLAQIRRVELHTSGFLRILFIGKNEEVLISFLDDGTALAKNRLCAALMHHNIPIVTK